MKRYLYIALRQQAGYMGLRKERSKFLYGKQCEKDFKWPFVFLFTIDRRPRKVGGGGVRPTATSSRY